MFWTIIVLQKLRVQKRGWFGAVVAIVPCCHGCPWNSDLGHISNFARYDCLLKSPSWNSYFHNNQTIKGGEKVVIIWLAISMRFSLGAWAVHQVCNWPQAEWLSLAFLEGWGDGGGALTPTSELPPSKHRSTLQHYLLINQARQVQSHTEKASLDKQA